MKKTKKQILGIAGLAAVGIMTAVAYGIPAPGAAAKESNTIVEVQVSEATPTNVFVSPRDGSETVESKIRVVTNYSYAVRLDFTLTYKDKDGVLQAVTLPSYTPTNESGTYSFELDVSQYGYGEFELSTSILVNGDIMRETDTVKFSYRPTTVEPQPGQSESCDPAICIEVSEDAEKVTVALFDKDGNPVKDKDGKPLVVEFNRSDINPETGKICADLPLKEHEVDPGEYTAVVSAYDKNGNLISTSSTQVQYAPTSPTDPTKPSVPGGDDTNTTPETPNTGMLSLGDLNISRADYLITGLMAFVVAVGAALLLIRRRSRR